MRCSVCSGQCGHANPDVPAICSTCLAAWDRYNQRLGLEAGSAVEAIAWAGRRTRRLQAAVMRREAMQKLMKELERKRIHMQSRDRAALLQDRRSGCRAEGSADPPSDADDEG
jgi:hypothetical protein